MIKNNLIYAPFSQWLFDLDHAKGHVLFDIDGKQYLDFTSGWNIANLGWNNEEIIKAMQDELSLNRQSCIWLTDGAQQKLTKLLIESTNNHWDTIAKTTGGTEANEVAVKTACAYTKRKKILSFAYSYHGQSLTTLALGTPKAELTNLPISEQDHIQIPFPSIQKDEDDKSILQRFEKILTNILSTEEIAAFITEAGMITGWGNLPIAPNGFEKIIRDLTKKYGTLWVLDEVGTGFSRTGKLFAYEHANEVPDIITIAKAFSNGAAPIGAMMTTRKIATESEDQSHVISSFGWNNLACSASLKTLQLHLNQEIWESTKEKGSHLKNSLKDAFSKYEKEISVRGKGLELVIQFHNKAIQEQLSEIQKECLQNGLHIVIDHDSCIQIMPPLTIPTSGLDEGVYILSQAVKSIYEN